MNQDSTTRIEPYVWKVAGVVILGMIMSILDTTIVNVALDTLAKDLHTTISEIQWVATGYLLSLAAVIPLTGWAARKFGAKNVYIWSIVLFTLGSALCGIAASSTSLIAFRVIQGIGGGMIMPIAQMIMAEVAGPKRMGKVMSVTVMPAMLAPILGPTIGGLILQNFHWSWIFFVNVPVGIVAALLAVRMLPHSKLGEPGKLDWAGLVLMVLGIPSLVFGISEVGTTGTFNSPEVIWPVIAGLLLIGAFIRHAYRAERPLLDVRLYANRVFGAASLTTFALGAALFGAMILMPLYYQQIRGESVIATGLLL
ncbi:MAG TPA: DHA2 family efflux MFS transporter permease subunit, partial [Solirubrobacterales bacterium]|nr:DHA2 family efflux MFS transporter permease subunit [Solirubrobacterales bacterium]